MCNKHTKTIMESINVVIDDSPEDKKEKEYEVSPHQIYVLENVRPKESNIALEITNFDDIQINKGQSIRVQKDHLIENIIGYLNE